MRIPRLKVNRLTLSVCVALVLLAVAVCFTYSLRPAQAAPKQYTETYFWYPGPDGTCYPAGADAGLEIRTCNGSVYMQGVRTQCSTTIHDSCSIEDPCC
jgi:hypothetical protein